MSSLWRCRSRARQQAVARSSVNRSLKGRGSRGRTCWMVESSPWIGRRFIATLAGVTSGCGARQNPSLALTARSRTSTGRVGNALVEWLPDETAIIICDMWNEHGCASASDRVADPAPRINEVVSAARELGVRIVHAPSSTVDFYEGTPARERALAAPPCEHVCVGSLIRHSPANEARIERRPRTRPDRCHVRYATNLM